MKTRFARALATIATAAFMTVSTVAAAAPAHNPAAALSVSKSPAARPATAGNKSRLGADIAGSTLISIGILAALVVIVLVATGGNGNDSPNSP
ncbi:hypothetical protein [Sphingomonas sp.]|uniref:hypothetical protein n=1 Tax=Sphingomonas sp. TaxID=28214 RepID=UPI0035BBF112